MKSGLRFADFVRCYHHQAATAQTSGVFTRVQRIKQKILVARHGKLRGLPVCQLTKHRLVARKGLKRPIGEG
jgi:hypothetical protein